MFLRKTLKSRREKEREGKWKLTWMKKDWRWWRSIKKKGTIFYFLLFFFFFFFLSRLSREDAEEIVELLLENPEG